MYDTSPWLYSKTVFKIKVRQNIMLDSPKRVIKLPINLLSGIMSDFSKWSKNLAHNIMRFGLIQFSFLIIINSHGIDYE